MMKRTYEQKKKCTKIRVKELGLKCLLDDLDVPAVTSIIDAGRPKNMESRFSGTQQFSYHGLQRYAA